MKLVEKLAKKLGISIQTTWGKAIKPTPLEMPEIKTPLSKADFDDIYGDLPDGAYMAAAEEMGVKLFEEIDPEQAKAEKTRERKDRLEVALMRIKKAGFTPVVCCETNSHVQIKEFGEYWNFWAWTGKMYKKGSPKIQERGVHNFIKKLKNDL